jgi:hypothetical protein
VPEVKVRRTGIQAAEASSAIRDALGGDIQITQTDDRNLDVRKNFFIRAKVSMNEEPGGTLFHVRGAGVPIPLMFGTMMLVNNQGIAKQIAAALGNRAEFRDNG